MEETLKYIDGIQGTGKPFFVVIWFGSPHKPHKPLQRYKDLYRDLPEEWQNYFGEITGIDCAMGNLRAGLKDRGLSAQTLIGYMSDNGSYKPADQITGLRRCKGEMWEGGIRVSGMIVWPEHITKPMETAMFANTLDIMPTLLDLLGITLEHRTLDGMSLLPLLRGTDMTPRSKTMPFWRDDEFARKSKDYESDFTQEQLTGWWVDVKCPTFTTARTAEFDGWAAWTEGKWKLHQTRRGHYELYDLVADPAESKDLASQMPGVVERLAANLKEWQCSAEVSLTGADNRTEPIIEVPSR